MSALRPASIRFAGGCGLVLLAAGRLGRPEYGLSHGQQLPLRADLRKPRRAGLSSAGAAAPGPPASAWRAWDCSSERSQAWMPCTSHCWAEWSSCRRRLVRCWASRCWRSCKRAGVPGLGWQGSWSQHWSEHPLQGGQAGCQQPWLRTCCCARADSCACSSCSVLSWACWRSSSCSQVLVSKPTLCAQCRATAAW